jgi:hypothetical protein
MGKTSRALTEVSDAGHFYHYEYVALHNQRMALVRRIDLWYQITFTASILIFTLVMNYGTKNCDAYAVGFGAAVSSILIILTWSFTRSLDRALVKLYPRIITLELVLDFRFYRAYLTGLKSRKGTEKRFVETVEAIEANTVAELYEKVFKAFERKDFPWRHRLPPILGIGAILLVLAFILAAGYVICTMRCGDRVFDWFD